jgi:tetratricopeptide (TPR) repeat protein
MRLLPRRNPRKFTKAESFCLFIEGVRALQLYDKEAYNPQPDKLVLDTNLDEAEAKFRKCVEEYPKDILPLYYYGIVLTLRGQVGEALQLQQELQANRPAARLASGGDDHDRLFLKAALVFEKVSQQTGGDLLAYAEYNQALALARTAPIRSHGTVR